VKRLLVPSAALLWGLQLAFLSPALALVLVTLFDATTAEVGWVLSVYNISGLLARSLCPPTPTAEATIYGRCWPAAC
jgi:SET family sugar efflux transporter-like MFS transporter